MRATRSASVGSGSSVEPAVAHRRLLGPAPGLRPFEDGSLFERIGGQATTDRMVDSLYDRFETDRVIRPLFGRDLAPQRDRQKLFFAEWLGGPPRYSESAWGGLYRHHEDVPITREVGLRWLDHLRHALGDALTDPADAAIILERAQTVAFALVNDERDLAARTPSTSKHRSEQIATCGVGARTLKRALLSAQGGSVEGLASLVAEIPDLVEYTPFAGRLLQRASVAGRIDVVEWLLDRGVDVNKPAALDTGLVGGAFELVFFVTPLCAARMMRRSDLSTRLLSRGARDDIFTAAVLGNLPFVREALADQPALAQIPDPATDVLTITPIHHAVGGGQLPTLRVLLAHTTEPVRTGGRALRGAAARGDREMVRLLLGHGADARTIGAGRWVLDPDLAPRLAAAGASAGVGVHREESGDWVRISCTGNQRRKDNPTLVEALLRYGARVDQLYNGATPLHYAAKAGFLQTIEVLLKHGADPDALDDRGRTPLDWLPKAAKSVDRPAVGASIRAVSRRSPTHR